MQKRIAILGSTGSIGGYRSNVAQATDGGYDFEITGASEVFDAAGTLMFLALVVYVLFVTRGEK